MTRWCFCRRTRPMASLVAAALDAHVVTTLSSESLSMRSPAYDSRPPPHTSVPLIFAILRIRVYTTASPSETTPEQQLHCSFANGIIASAPPGPLAHISPRRHSSILCRSPNLHQLHTSLIELLHLSASCSSLCLNVCRVKLVHSVLSTTCALSTSGGSVQTPGI